MPFPKWVAETSLIMVCYYPFWTLTTLNSGMSSENYEVFIMKNLSTKEKFTKPAQIACYSYYSDTKPPQVPCLGYRPGYDKMGNPISSSK